MSSPAASDWKPRSIWNTSAPGRSVCGTPIPICYPARQEARHRAVTRLEAIEILTSHREEIREYGVSRLSLFGSVVRDQAGPASDIDLLVEFAHPVGYFEFLDLKAYLEEILGREVDLVPRNALKRQLRDRILAEAVDAA